MVDEKKVADSPAPAATTASNETSTDASGGKPKEGLAKVLAGGANPFKKHFSSTPLDPNASAQFADKAQDLTNSERTYLETLLKTGDQTLIERASQRLCDPMLFPPVLNQCAGLQRREDSSSATEEAAQSQVDAAAEAAATAAEASLGTSNGKRRDSQLQQELFRLHEEKAVQPSHVLKRLNFVHKNSLLESADFDESGGDRGEHPETPGGSEMAAAMDSLNPFKDVSSWLDGGQGVEVNNSGKPLMSGKPSQRHHDPFRILGTAADDASCHPHVLSPPLMESLLAFLPEPLSGHNFWLKYSLVRDGPGIWTMIRQVRASDNSFLAI